MEQDLYQDMKARTNGEIYIGVVGPVRTGKSTFIKRFMDVCVLPNMENEYEKKQAMDELPQSGTGKTITTTEPKFIPSEAAKIQLDEKTSVKIRLIDCVGYMVDGAMGHMEENAQRMVKTPWLDEEIPFTQAAELGTEKVISDHSTIGIVVVTDGSFSDIPTENYFPALEKTITQLKVLQKPFVVLLNTTRPYAKETEELERYLKENYAVNVIPVNCAQLKEEDVHTIMEHILYEFPIRQVSFYLPGWVSMLPEDHPIRKTLLNQVKDKMDQLQKMQDIRNLSFDFDQEYINKISLDQFHLDDGSVSFSVSVKEESYFSLLSDMLDEQIEDEYELFQYLSEAAKRKNEYEQVKSAMESVRQKGYGVVTPMREEITLQKPEVIHHGNKYGVKIKAQSPSIHMIRANIETEIAPIVGTKEQAEDLITYISSSKEQGQKINSEQNNGEAIWETNIFGKTVEQLVQDGINTKLNKISDESQVKLQDTMQKIVNDSNGGMVCIII